MECPHLANAALVTAPVTSKQSRRSRTPNGATGKIDGYTSHNTQSIYCQTLDCGTNKSPWCCCHCGEIACGRYVKGHMKEHYEKNNEHCVCFDCTSFAVYCYKCDEYVVNDSDSDKIQRLRAYFQSLDPQNDMILDIENSKDMSKKRKHHHSSSGNHKKKKTHPKTVGLRNLGNTCFMNAVLQSLNNIPEFSKYIQKLPSLDTKHRRHKVQESLRQAAKTVGTSTRSAPVDNNVILVEEFRKTLVELRRSRTALSPASLFAVIWKVVPTFRGYQQQDAHEFMRYLLDRLHQELLTLLPQNSLSLPNRLNLAGVKNSVVTAIFGGILQSEVRCLNCGMTSIKHDPFLDLSLDIPINKPKPSSAKDGDSFLTVVPCTIQDCLQSFTDVEELSESERYTCGHCKRKHRSTKKFWIRRLPNVLCLHLKRFRWCSFLRTKIETFVEFPITKLDMSCYQLNNLRRTRDTSGSSEYDLAAVVVHHGSGAGSGHYTSFATHDRTWYHFNDSTVTACSEDAVAKSKAYILFYVRKELKL